MTSEARILPLEPPFDPETEESLARWMPPGSPVPPLALFRTLARHPMLRDRMRPLGAGLLARGVLPPRARELLVLRTTARCGATYEWGVHATAFAGAVGLDPETVRATATASPSDVAARTDDDALLLRAADELHDGAALSDATFTAVHSRFADEGVLEIAAVVGFYHLISFVLGAARLPDEPWTVAFPR
jgi:alkylhydroperoxidase family enzyme